MKNIYVVWHFASDNQFYFSNRPTKAELLKVIQKYKLFQEDHTESENLSFFEIEKVRLLN